MRFKKLDMNLLAALDVLLRTCNVSKAAEEMFITQSAMSNALARLRTYFDDPLLIQVGRRMELSPFAETIRDPLRDVMLRIESTVITSPQFDPRTSTRELTIALSDYSLAVLGAALVQRLADEAPLVRVNFRPQHATPGKLLERGEIDLLIAPDFTAADSSVSETLYQDDICVIACARSSHAGKVMDLERITGAPHVVMEPFSGQESFAVIAAREAGLKLSPVVTTYAFNSIPDLVRGTDRIALLQRRLGQKAAASGDFVLFDPPVALPRLSQTMQWLGHRERDPGLVWLRGLVRACVDDMCS